MATFFVSSTNSDFVILEENDSKHAIKVLRLKNNDLVDIIDGFGTLIRGIIVDAHPKKAKVKILAKEKNKKPIMLGLAFCPTKNNDRNDWIIEKATEIGVTDFHPIYSQNSERRKLNVNRMKKITISAIKQSGNLWLPKIHPLISINSFLEKRCLYNNKLMAHCREGIKLELKKITNNNDSQIIIIGPEGDFTSQEIDKAIKYNFKMISLGSNRLRTETACISAISIMRLG